MRCSWSRPYLTGGDVAATTATDQSRRLGRLGRPKIACALTKAETSPRLLPVYIYLDLQLDLSFDDVNTSSVAEKSLQRLLSLQQGLGDVAETSPQSPAGLGGRRGDVAGTSPQSRVKLVSATNGDVAETSRRCLRDLLETERSLRKNRTCLIFPRTPRRPGLSPGDVAATSRRRLRD